jgi:hypothetical protein
MLYGDDLHSTDLTGITIVNNTFDGTYLNHSFTTNTYGFNSCKLYYLGTMRIPLIHAQQTCSTLEDDDITAPTGNAWFNWVYK